MFFAIKATIITVVLVFFMQIKFGEHTLEQKAYHWIKSSYLVVELNQVSSGAVIALREVYQGLSQKLTRNVKQSFKQSFTPGERSIVPDLSRSPAYLQGLRKKAEEVDLHDLQEQVKTYRQQLDELSRESSSGVVEN